MSHLLALDLSLNRPGFAVLTVTARSVSIAEVGHIDVDTRGTTHGERLRQIRECIGHILDRYTDLERVVPKEAATPTESGVILAKAHGVTEERMVGFTFVDYDNGTVKRIVGGHGKAEKHEVESGVRSALGLGADFIFATDDESDAVAVGLTHLALNDRLPRNKRFDALRERVDEWRDEQAKKDAAKARRKARLRAAKKSTA